MPNGAKNWFYTLNNPTDDDVQSLFRLPTGAIFHVVGREVGSSGTPHLQGTLGYSQRRTLQQIKNDLSLRLHLEPTRRVLASIAYCRKDGDYEQFGDIPTGATCGKRTDLEEFKKAVKDGIYSLKELRDNHSEVLAKYPRFCVDYIRDNRPLREVEDHPLRPWQADLYHRLSLPPNSREILFVVDLRGNEGKSWFADYYHYHHQETTQVLNPGKKADMSHALNEHIRVLFLDAPRSKQGEYIQYDFLEDVKNGRVFSGKYESGMKYLPPCHVVVLMNEHPDMSKLSEDRYNIREIN